MLLLPLAAEAAELRVEAPFAAEDAARWEAVAAEGWSTWTARFGVSAARPRLTVARGEGLAALRDLGRLRDGRILLGPAPSAPGITDDDVVRHEVAHAFLEAACPAVAREAPLVSEAFALFATGDAARRTLSSTRFPFAREAREVLLREAVGARGDEPAIQEALARVLAQPGVEARAEETFRGILAGCATQDPSAAKDALLALVRGGPRAVVPATTSVLVMDGLSGEILVDEGATSVPSRVGSILKPFLVATVPAFLESRLARGTVEWRCDVEAGERLSYSDALARSCNGFFLDAGSGLPADSFAAFDALIAAVSKPVPSALAFESRLGLTPGLALSPREVVRLYAWLVASAPFAVDALTKTPVSGTLAGLPDAPFFVERRIALKTGTVRDARGVPHDGWIVAVGPRDADGRPTFLAAVHGAGRAPASLLPLLRRALEDLPPSSVARVQVLGLAPSGIARASCEGGTPMLTRSAEGPLAFGPSALERGSSFACPASALLLEIPSKGGASRVKRVFGTLHVGDVPEALPESTLPVREKNARARRGSRYVLETSERAYLESSLLSELPNAPPELSTALAAVLRRNLHAPRHGDRPICDTTHCQVFGQDTASTPGARRRARAAVRASMELVIDSQESWLPFSLGGDESWTETRSLSEVERLLALEFVSLAFRDGRAVLGNDRGGETVLPCELLRNQTRLPSCPDRATLNGDLVIFEGRGEGHGLGLDLVSAARDARNGATAREILRKACSDRSADVTAPKAAQK